MGTGTGSAAAISDSNSISGSGQRRRQEQGQRQQTAAGTAAATASATRNQRPGQLFLALSLFLAPARSRAGTSVEVPFPSALPERMPGTPTRGEPGCQAPPPHAVHPPWTRGRRCLGEGGGNSKLKTQNSKLNREWVGGVLNSSFLIPNSEFVRGALPAPPG